MSDTLPHAEAYLEARYRERTPGQRIAMACGMYATAVALARAGIVAAEPSLAESEVRLRVFERMYRDDLPPHVIAAVAARVRGQLGGISPARRVV